MERSALDGFRVLDLGRVLAGPMLGQLLADMGAEVIKVESHQRMDGTRLGRPIIGDDIAGGDEGKWPNMQPMFHAVNRNKMAVTLDLKSPQGRQTFLDMASVSDVVTENFSPGVMDSLGLGYEELRGVRPDIVMISMSGPGAWGPRRHIVTYASQIAALCGMAAFIGYEDEEGLGISQTHYCDAAAATAGATAVCQALYYRQRTGRGQFIDLSQWEADTAFHAEAIIEYSMNKRVLRARGNYHPRMAPYNAYRCKGDDAWITIAVDTEEAWRGLCRVAGHPEWASDSRFRDMYERLRNRKELDKTVSEWTRNEDAYALMEQLQAAGVAAMPVMNIQDLYFNPHHQARKAFVETNHPLVGVEPIYGIPWRLDKTPGRIRLHAPSVGEHNAYIYQELLAIQGEMARSLEEKKVFW